MSPRDHRLTRDQAIELLADAQERTADEVRELAQRVAIVETRVEERTARLDTTGPHRLVAVPPEPSDGFAVDKRGVRLPWKAISEIAKWAAIIVGALGGGVAGVRALLESLRH